MRSAEVMSGSRTSFLTFVFAGLVQPEYLSRGDSRAQGAGLLYSKRVVWCSRKNRKSFTSARA